MSSNLQYRFRQHETPPPPGSWSVIASRLGEEYSTAETALSEKIYNQSTAVPPLIWDRITGELDTDLTTVGTHTDSEVVQMEKRSPGMVVPFNFRKVAAIGIVFLAVAALYYFMTGNKENPQQLVSATESPKQSAIVPLAPQVAMAAPPVGSRNRSTRSTTAKTIRYASRDIQSDANAGTEVPYVEEPEYDDINYSTISDAEQVAEAPISIPTQPIRDKEGNIIMDEKLVSAPDVNYVTVTAPNGEQTKISKKFMGALGYMNSGMVKDDYIGLMLQEGSSWKWLFQEWRNKLLKQPSFIPTATNFLDIMELKEMLHENF